MSFLKVDQTLMLRRGNWSKGILNYLMRGSLSERFLFLSSFILPDHMADLYITKELPGWPSSFKTPSWSRDAVLSEPRFWSESDPQWGFAYMAAHSGGVISLKYCAIKIQAWAYWNIYGSSLRNECVINSRLKVLAQALCGDLFKGWY